MPFGYISIREKEKIDIRKSGDSVVIETGNMSIFLHESHVAKIVRWVEERNAVQYEFPCADNINVISGLKK